MPPEIYLYIISSHSILYFNNLDKKKTLIKFYIEFILFWYGFPLCIIYIHIIIWYANDKIFKLQNCLEL